MQHFVNTGFGWTCRRCQTEEAATHAAKEEATHAASPPPSPRAPEESARGRFFSEGEAEEREPRLSTVARARWRDDSRRALVCPRCGVAEEVGT